MPGARFFIIAHPLLYLARWKGRRRRLQSVLRRAAVLPLLPAALYSSFWIFMQPHKI